MGHVGRWGGGGCQHKAHWPSLLIWEVRLNYSRVNYLTYHKWVLCSGPLICFCTRCLSSDEQYLISLLYTHQRQYSKKALIYLHIAMSAQCQKRWYRGGWHARMCVSSKEHYPHMHRKKRLVSECTLSPFANPPLRLLTPSIPHYCAGELGLKRERGALTQLLMRRSYANVKRTRSESTSTAWQRTDAQCNT